MAAASVINPSINGFHSAKDNGTLSKLNFYLEPSKGGHSYFTAGTIGQYRRKFDERPVNIHDARGYETDFNLDTHGFQFYRRPSAEKDFLEDAHIKAVYYPEVEQLLKDVAGATSVHVFSHITRRDNPARMEAALVDNSATSSDTTPVAGIFPARYVHIDQSPVGALQVLQDSFDTSSSLGRHALENGGRWGIINVWRPISRIRRDPLAVCDARTVNERDLVPTCIYQPPKDRNTQYAHTTKGDTLEMYYARYAEEQQWYFVSSMETDEVLFIKCYDSSTREGLARRCPHSAFEWVEEGHDGSSVRESIETRCLVFWEDQKS